MIRRKLDALHCARTLQDLRLPAGNRVEVPVPSPLSASSLPVNEQDRITFRVEDGHAYDVTCEDDY